AQVELPRPGGGRLGGHHGDLPVRRPTTEPALAARVGAGLLHHRRAHRRLHRDELRGTDMSTSTYSAEQEALFAAYTRTTNTWGRITLFAGFVIATSVPFIVMATTDLDISLGQIITAFIAV